MSRKAFEALPGEILVGELHHDLAVGDAVVVTAVEVLGIAVDEHLPVIVADVLASQVTPVGADLEVIDPVCVEEVLLADAPCCGDGGEEAPLVPGPEAG